MSAVRRRCRVETSGALASAIKSACRLLGGRAALEHGTPEPLMRCGQTAAVSAVSRKTKRSSGLLGGTQTTHRTPQMRPERSCHQVEDPQRTQRALAGGKAGPGLAKGHRLGAVQTWLVWSSGSPNRSAGRVWCPIRNKMAGCSAVSIAWLCERRCWCGYGAVGGGAPGNAHSGLFCFLSRT
jgi:hypothetical protein